MELALSTEKESFKFNFRHLLLLVVLFTGTALFIYNYKANVVADKAVISVEDASELAEEIYSSGDIEQLTKLPLRAVALAKLASEIDGVLKKSIDHPRCEVYFLQARVSGNYPVLGYGDVIIDYLPLVAGEVWKVGMTQNGEEGRYPGQVYINNKKLDLKFTNEELLYNVVFVGSYKKVLILEKILIYTYPVWSGHPEQIKPPGCKIFR